MANQFFMPFRPAYDTAGISMPGAQLYFTLYDAGGGGNVPSSPFQDAALSLHHANPVVARGSGKFPIIYLDPAKSYRVRTYASAATVGVDSPVEEYNPYVPGILDATSLDPLADAAAASAAAAAASAAAVDIGRVLRAQSGQTLDEIDKTDFIGQYWVGDAEGDPVPSAGTVTGGDATLRADLANPAAGASLVGYQRSGGVSQGVYHFISREKCTPLEYPGATGDGVALDTVALTAAVTSGKRVRIPFGYTFKTRGGLILPSNSQIEGDGGLIDFDASASTWLFAPGAAGASADCSNIAIEGVRFTSTSDVGFMHLVTLTNTGLIDHFQFNHNIVDYPVVPGTSDDRWVLASGGSGGTRTNFNVDHNQVTGPMQLIASAIGGHTLKHASFSWNRLKNTRANAIAIVSLGGLGNANTGEDIVVQGNDIYADLYTVVGIFLGIDQTSTDKCVALRRIKIIENTIKILGSQPDIYWRLGNKCASIGGFDSVADQVTIADNDLYNGFQVTQEAPATASGKSQATNFVFSGNRVHGGDVTFSDLADDSRFIGNSARDVAVRPSTGNGKIFSAHNVWRGLVGSTADAEFTWNASNDVYVGSTTAFTDRPIFLTANAAKVQVANFKNCTIDSYSPNGTTAAISVNGAGAPTVTVRNLATSTTWASGRYERVSGTITDLTAGELFSATVDPPNITTGNADIERTLSNVYGAVVGDIVSTGFSNDLLGLEIVARVSAANTIKYYFRNPNGNPNGAQNLASGTVSFRFRSQSG